MSDNTKYIGLRSKEKIVVVADEGHSKSRYMPLTSPKGLPVFFKVRMYRLDDV